MTAGEVTAKFSDLASLAGVRSQDAADAAGAALGLARGGSFAALTDAVARLVPAASRKDGHA
jgi:hypothetical protein